MRVENVWEGKKLSNINKETSQEYIKAIEIFRKCKSSGKSAMQKDVNLLDVMQLLENAHTNVLWEILKYEDSNGNHLFFESFIRDFLHLNINFNSAAVFAENTDSGTQYRPCQMIRKAKIATGKECKIMIEEAL